MTNLLVKKTKIQAHRIERLCENCDNGTMKFTGSSGAGLYQHQCDPCGEIEYFRKQYPRVEFQDSGEWHLAQGAETPLPDWQAEMLATHQKHYGTSKPEPAICPDLRPPAPSVKIVFIAHPISGDVQGNLAKIAAIVKQINFEQPMIVPFVPYYVDCLAMDDAMPWEREKGIQNDRVYFERKVFDELWVYGLSPGVQAEIDLAKQLNIPIKYKIHEKP